MSSIPVINTPASAWCSAFWPSLRTAHTHAQRFWWHWCPRVCRVAASVGQREAADWTPDSNEDLKQSTTPSIWSGHGLKLLKWHGVLNSHQNLTPQTLFYKQKKSQSTSPPYLSAAKEHYAKAACLRLVYPGISWASLPCVSSGMSAKELWSCSDLMTTQYHPRISIVVLQVSCIVETFSFWVIKHSTTEILKISPRWSRLLFPYHFSQPDCTSCL